LGLLVLVVGGCAARPAQEEDVGNTVEALAFAGSGVLLDGSLNVSAECVGTQGVATASGVVLAAAPPSSNVELTADVGSDPTQVFTAIMPGDFVDNGSEFEASYSVGVNIPNGPVSVSFCLQDADLMQQVCFPPVDFDQDCAGIPPPTDTTPPTIMGSAAPAANANGWNNTDVLVSFVCEDEMGGSGIASCTAPVTLSSEGAGQSVAGSAADNAGNMASTMVGPINIDKTDPSVSITGARAYQLHEQVEVHCSASDSLSGIASSTCTDVSAPAWSIAPGSHTASGTAVDNADNDASASASYSVSVTTAGVCGLIKQWVPNRLIAHVLCAKLELAQHLKGTWLRALANALISSVKSTISGMSGVQNKAILLGLVEALR
jgi:hypothetical protein